MKKLFAVVAVILFLGACGYDSTAMNINEAYVNEGRYFFELSGGEFGPRTDCEVDEETYMQYTTTNNSSEWTWGKYDLADCIWISDPNLRED